MTIEFDTPANNCAGCGLDFVNKKQSQLFDERGETFHSLAQKLLGQDSIAV